MMLHVSESTRAAARCEPRGQARSLRNGVERCGRCLPVHVPQALTQFPAANDPYRGPACKERFPNFGNSVGGSDSLSEPKKKSQAFPPGSIKDH